MKTTSETTVRTTPTADMPLGIYRVVCERGLYWGTFKVTVNWCGERFVMEWNY